MKRITILKSVLYLFQINVDCFGILIYIVKTLLHFGVSANTEILPESFEKHRNSSLFGILPKMFNPLHVFGSSLPRDDSLFPENTSFFSLPTLRSMRLTINRIHIETQNQS